MAEMKFVIIASPRTGTNHFIDLLNSHQNITCHSEVFHRNTVYLFEGAKDLLLELRDRDPFLFLENLYESTQAMACGFKIFGDHNAEVLNRVLYETTIKKIILYRPNFLAVYSSEKIAEAEKRYLIWEQNAISIDAGAYESKRTSEKAQFDPEEFHRRWTAYQEHYKHALDVLNNTGQEYLFVTYEDFINESFFRRVFPFLGLTQPQIVHTRMRKLNSSDILSRFLNPDEARAYIEKIGRLNWAHEGFMLWCGKE